MKRRGRAKQKVSDAARPRRTYMALVLLNHARVCALGTALVCVYCTAPRARPTRPSPRQDTTWHHWLFCPFGVLAFRSGAGFSGVNWSPGYLVPAPNTDS